MIFTREARYRSPSGREQRAATRGTFAATLPPLPAKLPNDVGACFGSLNRRERRRFAAKARAHTETRREEVFVGADGSVTHNPDGSCAIHEPATDESCPCNDGKPEGCTFGLEDDHA